MSLTDRVGTHVKNAGPHIGQEDSFDSATKTNENQLLDLHYSLTWLNEKHTVKAGK